MPAKTLLPPPYLTLEDLNGATITGGTVTFLETGTAVLAVVYADANGLVISANPLTVDGAGRYTVFLTPGQVVDVEYRDASGTLVKTVPAVQAIPSASGNVDVSGTFGEAVTAGQVVYLSDGSGGKTAGRWFLAVGTGQIANISVLGMALTTGALGATGTIRTEGRVTDLAGLVVGAKYYLSATPGAVSLAIAPNYRVLGQADTTTSLILCANPFDPRLFVDTVAATGAVPQLVLASPAPQSVLLTNASLLTIQGIKAGYQGQRIRFFSSAGSGQVDFVHLSPAAAGADKLFNLATSAPTSLAPGGFVEYEYNLTFGLWKLVAHEQGGWITPAFSAADYTASGGMTWTVTAGQVSRAAYYLQGKALRFQLGTTGTLGGVVGNSLFRRLPGGFASAGGAIGASRSIDGNNTPLPTAYWQVSPATGVSFFNALPLTNYTLGASLAVFADMTIEVV